MAVIPLNIVDAFATRPFAGNPAAIIPNANTLTTEEMIRISEELGMEVGFVLPSDQRGADVRLRFFIDRSEDTLSGHVLMAALACMADRGIFRPKDTSEGTLLHVETLAGVLQCRLLAEPEGLTRINCEMPNPRFGEVVPPDEVAAALDMPADQLRVNGHGPQRVSCGFDQIIVPVADPKLMLGSLKDMDRVQALLDERGAAGLSLFCPETRDPNSHFQCRFLHPDDRRTEDIASGTCMAAVAAYAVTNGLIPITDRMVVITEQGHALGRPTTCEVIVRMVENGISSIYLSSTGAVVMRGSLQFNRLNRSMVAEA